MLNLFQHRINETLKQVQGDARQFNSEIVILSKAKNLQGIKTISKEDSSLHFVQNDVHHKDFGWILGFRIERP